MEKRYIKLFEEICKTTETLAETVMEYDRGKSDTKGEETAKIMRDDYAALSDKIGAPDFDGVLTKAEYAKILVGTYIVVNNLRDRITAMRKALNGYENDVIVKLQEVLDNAETDEDAQKLAEEKFILEDNE